MPHALKSNASHLCLYLLIRPLTCTVSSRPAHYWLHNPFSSTGPRPLGSGPGLFSMLIELCNPC